MIAHDTGQPNCEYCITLNTVTSKELMRWDDVTCTVLSMTTSLDLAKIITLSSRTYIDDTYEYCNTLNTTTSTELMCALQITIKRGLSGEMHEVTCSVLSLHRLQQECYPDRASSLSSPTYKAIPYSLNQGNLKEESVVAAILPSRMEVSYCTSVFFCS